MTPSVNLIPASRIARRKCRRRVRAWAVIVGAYAACVVLACVWSIAAMAHLGDAERAQLAETRRDNEQMVEDGLRKRTELADTAAIVRANMIVRLEPDWSVLMALIADVLGEDAVLESLHLQHAEPDQEGAEATTEYTVFLTGASRSQMDVSSFILRLESLGLFDRVVPISSGQAMRGDELVGFALRCELGAKEPPQ